MTDQAGGRVYDLEKRTAIFGESIIDFARTIRKDTITRPLINQMVRSDTSVGANYCEADDALTNKEFRHRIGLCRSEARETKYWLRMIVRADGSLNGSARPLWREAREFHLIFAAILRHPPKPPKPQSPALH